MGDHQPESTSLLQRMKTKRALVAVAASGAVLAAGGVAGAAVVGGAQPQDLNSAAKVPQAQTSEQAADEQAPDQEQVDKEREQAQQEREEAASQAEGSASGTAAQAEEEKEEEPEQESSSQDDSSGSESGSGESSGLTPTGQGGTCEASMYSDPQPTASGGTFDPSAMTAAHKELPFGTKVEVTNPSNGKSVVVSINDRGPYIAGRCLDLSTASFETIASASQGVVDVEWQVVG
ncbi:septal ring lytic transglycosylase RlpA family protein [Nocardiopsis halophila]|uniref:septal ring lytic transglycosylase RlpA family protein n=1 Tax=Nocardiopsis halophila TaxID=141692 RepID=UPI000349846D|nr:septal ring lytic transglycosylase RlpA family protein [Nocardiopsis halophila]